MKLSIIVPVFNEEKTIIELLNKLEIALVKLSNKIISYNIIVINDGSTDNTEKLIKESRFFNNSNYLFKFLPQNKGKGLAITTGFSLSDGDIVLIQDADLEYDPNDYNAIISPILEDLADVVYGSRFKSNKSRVLYYHHYLGNRFLTFLSNLFTNINLSDMETCYKVFKGDIIRNMILISKRFGIEPEMTAKLSKLKNIRIYEVPISYNGRTYKDGKKIGWKDGIAAIYSIFRFNVFWSAKKSFKKN